MPARALVVALLLLAGRGQAQTAPVDEPEAVYREFLRHSAARRFLEAARLLYHPVMEERRLQFVQSMRTFRRYVPTLADITRGDPDMPPAVAEYQLAKMKEQMQQSFDPFAEEWAGVKDTTELLALPLEQAAARWVEARDPSTMLRRAFAMSPSCRNKAFPTASLPVVTPVVAGTLVRGDTAYVLVRSTSADGATDMFWDLPPSVVTLRRMDRRWFIWPSHSLGRGEGWMIAVSCDSVPR